MIALTGGKISSVLSLLSQKKGDLLFCIMNSGNIFYGCLITGSVAVIILSKYYRIHAVNMLDVCASILPLGQSIGRIGCFCNGCCYGIDYKGFLAVAYPIDGVYRYIFPTWFFESFFCLCLFVLFQKMIRSTFSGIVASTYIIFYSVFRFFIEFLRGDNIRGYIFIFSTSQFLSIFLLPTGILLLIISLKTRKENDLIYRSDII